MESQRDSLVVILSSTKKSSGTKKKRREKNTQMSQTPKKANILRAKGLAFVDLKNYDIAENKLLYMQFNLLSEHLKKRNAEVQKNLENALLNMMADQEILLH